MKLHFRRCGAFHHETGKCGCAPLGLGEDRRCNALQYLARTAPSRGAPATTTDEVLPLTYLPPLPREF